MEFAELAERYGLQGALLIFVLFQMWKFLRDDKDQSRIDLEKARLAQEKSNNALIDELRRQIEDLQMMVKSRDEEIVLLRERNKLLEEERRRAQPPGLR